MPLILRMGSASTNRIISPSSGASLNCPSGLFMSEQTLASLELGAIPALAVSPPVLSFILALGERKYGVNPILYMDGM